MLQVGRGVRNTYTLFIYFSQEQFNFLSLHLVKIALGCFPDFSLLLLSLPFSIPIPFPTPLFPSPCLRSFFKPCLRRRKSGKRSGGREEQEWEQPLLTYQLLFAPGASGIQLRVINPRTNHLVSLLGQGKQPLWKPLNYEFPSWWKLAGLVNLGLGKGRAKASHTVSKLNISVCYILPLIYIQPPSSTSTSCILLQLQVSILET